MSADKCLVIFSGGQDSTTALYWAKQNFQEVHAITFDYGQKHRIEIEAARKIARMVGIGLDDGLLMHKIVELPSLLKGMSPLTNPHQKLEQYENYEQMQAIIGDRVELTFVPMRNALFLVLAANRAHCAGIKHLVTGVCEADGANYPDCRRDFIHASEVMFYNALGSMMRIHTPLIALKKSDSVKLALTLPGCYTALAYSHTAYDGQYPPTGKDHASVLRAHGFEEAGVPDPLVLRASLENRMKIPETSNYRMLDDMTFTFPENAKVIHQSLLDFEQKLRAMESLPL